jgi:hypothetical protein
MKFKIGFTVQAETLFHMMSKFLPIEELHVEEIFEAPPTKPQSAIAKLVAKSQSQLQLEKPKAKPKVKIEHFKHPSGKTVQDFVVEYLKSHPSATWAEMSAYTVSIGYNKSSINNAVTRLVYKKIVEKVAPGIYRLTKNARTEQAKAS